MFTVTQQIPNDFSINWTVSESIRITELLFRTRIASAPTCPNPNCNAQCVPTPITNPRESNRHRLPIKWTCPQPFCTGQQSFLFRCYLYGNNLSLELHVRLLYKFYLGRSAHEAKTELNISREKTVSGWFDYFRRNISNWMQNDFYPNFEFAIEFAIQWDEACVAKGQKHHRGRRRASKWVLGGVQEQTGLVALKYVGRSRDGETLENFIIPLSPVGSTHVTDGWRGYFGLNTYGLVHWNVLHEHGFVNPITLYHTNTIENLWSIMRGFFAKYRGIPEEKIQVHLDEFAFRRNMRHTEEGVWLKMLMVIGEKQHSTAKPQ
eukprot:431778_1